MAFSDITSGTIALVDSPDHCIGDSREEAKQTQSFLLALPRDARRELVSLARTGKGCRLELGKVAHLRVGAATFDLRAASEPNRTELYHSHQASDMRFSALVTHSLVPISQRKDEVQAEDVALEVLKTSLASKQQEKESKQTQMIPKLAADDPRKRSLKSIRNQIPMLGKPGLLGSAAQSVPSSPRPGNHAGVPASVSRPKVTVGTSTANNSTAKTRHEALKHAVVHLLAIRPLSVDAIANRTCSSKNDCLEVLNKITKPTSDPLRALTDKAFKELNVWRFRYEIHDDRRVAIDNAIKAYDRLRLSKADNLWQLLLPKAERGKGKVLSKLNLGQGPRPGLGPGTTSVRISRPVIVPAQDDSADAQMPQNLARSKVKVSEREKLSKRLLSKKPLKQPAARVASLKSKGNEDPSNTQGTNAKDIKSKSVDLARDPEHTDNGLSRESSEQPSQVGTSDSWRPLKPEIDDKAQHTDQSLDSPGKGKRATKERNGLNSLGKKANVIATTACTPSLGGGHVASDISYGSATTKTHGSKGLTNPAPASLQAASKAKKSPETEVKDGSAVDSRATKQVKVKTTIRARQESPGIVAPSQHSVSGRGTKRKHAESLVKSPIDHAKRRKTEEGKSQRGRVPAGEQQKSLDPEHGTQSLIKPRGEDHKLPVEEAAQGTQQNVTPQSDHQISGSPKAVERDSTLVSNRIHLSDGLDAGSHSDPSATINSPEITNHSPQPLSLLSNMDASDRRLSTSDETSMPPKDTPRTPVETGSSSNILVDSPAGEPTSNGAPHSLARSQALRLGRHMLVQEDVYNELWNSVTTKHREGIPYADYAEDELRLLKFDYTIRAWKRDMDTAYWNTANTQEEARKDYAAWQHDDPDMSLERGAMGGDDKTFRSLLDQRFGPGEQRARDRFARMHRDRRTLTGGSTTKAEREERLYRIAKKYNATLPRYQALWLDLCSEQSEYPLMDPPRVQRYDEKHKKLMQMHERLLTWKEEMGAEMTCHVSVVDPDDSRGVANVEASLGRGSYEGTDEMRIEDRSS